MAIRSVSLPDSITARLSVHAPWWSWLWLGLIYQPARGRVECTRPERREVRKWYCVWLCTVTQTVNVPANIDRITLEGMGYTGNEAGDTLSPIGPADCSSCASRQLYAHNFGFPVPPWLGGGGFQGVGFRGTVVHRGRREVLHDHWGSAGTLPPDFL